MIENSARGLPKQARYRTALRPETAKTQGFPGLSSRCAEPRQEYRIENIGLKRANKGLNRHVTLTPLFPVCCQRSAFEPSLDHCRFLGATGNLASGGGWCWRRIQPALDHRSLLGAAGDFAGEEGASRRRIQLPTDRGGDALGVLQIFRPGRAPYLASKVARSRDPIGMKLTSRVTHGAGGIEAKPQPATDYIDRVRIAFPAHRAEHNSGALTTPAYFARHRQVRAAPLRGRHPAPDQTASPVSNPVSRWRGGSLPSRPASSK